MRSQLIAVIAVAAVAAVAAGCSATDTIDSAPTVSPSSTTDLLVATTDPTPSTSVPEMTTAPPTAVASTTEPPPPTSTTAAPTTTSTTAAPTTTTTVPALSDGYALVYAGSGEAFAWQRVGAWDRSQWVDLDPDAVSPAADIATVSVASVDLPTVAADVAYSNPDYVCVDAPLHTGLLPEVVLPESPLGYGYQAVAVTADWSLQPRPVTAVGLDAAVYQEVGESLLADRAGIDPADGDVVQVIRVDLDGDGTEEVLVSFRHLSASQFGETGDFSIVYARFVQPDGSVDDRIVWEHVVPDSPTSPAVGRASVAAVADLNGDGVMEVAIRSVFWEFAGIEIYEMNETGLVPIMSGGCGV